MSGQNCRRAWGYFGRPWTHDLSISKILATALCLVQFRFLSSFYIISFIVRHIYFFVHIHIYWKNNYSPIYMFVCLLICQGVARGLCVIRSCPHRMIQRLGWLTCHHTWSVWLWAKVPWGQFQEVNSQMECQKQYTSLSSLFFLRSFHRNAPSPSKLAKKSQK